MNWRGSREGNTAIDVRDETRHDAMSMDEANVECDAELQCANRKTIGY